MIADQQKAREQGRDDSIKQVSTQLHPTYLSTVNTPEKAYFAIFWRGISVFKFPKIESGGLDCTKPVCRSLMFQSALWQILFEWQVPAIEALSDSILPHVTSGRGQLRSHMNSKVELASSADWKSVVKYSVNKSAQVVPKKDGSLALIQLRTWQKVCRIPAHKWDEARHLLWGMLA